MPAETATPLWEGIAAVKAGDAARGRGLLEQAAADEPHNDVPWVWLSSIAASPAEAADYLRTALELNPRNKYAAEALARLLVPAGIEAARRNDRAAAAELFDEAIRIDPKNEPALLWRAGLTDDPDEGIRFLEAVLAVNPNSERAKQGIAHFESLLPMRWKCPVCDAPDRRDPGAACPHCKAVLSLDDPARFDRATGADVRAMKAAAARLYEAAKSGKDAKAVYALGVCYLNLGYRAEGIQTLQAAARHRGADPAWKPAVAALAGHFDRPAVQASGGLARPRVLVVDDSPTIQKLVATTLNAAGYDVTTAGSGQQAVQTIQSVGPPVLFVLDVNMPGMDGFELCKLFRHTPDTAKVPVVFLTGKDGLFAKLRGQWVGASDYLIKPFDPQKLVAAVSKLVPIGVARG